MKDLVEFIEAQLDEDEAAARWSAEHAPGASQTDPNSALFDPGRVLREVAYKRRVLARHGPVIDGTQSSWTWFAGSESVSERELRDLASVWSDDPDYREEWAPR